jgi:hypothetical protein
MREITISIDVFATLWALRRPEEQSENEILQRVLREYAEFESVATPSASAKSQAISQHRESTEQEDFLRVDKEVDTSDKTRTFKLPAGESEMGKIRWVDDVRAALRGLGGSASLHEIYKATAVRRRDGNRSIPRTLEATVRRTLEDHSSDSANFRGADIFTNIGRGEWALRDRAAS